MKKLPLLCGFLGCAASFAAIALNITATPGRATEDIAEIRFHNRTETVGVTHSDARQDINFKTRRGFRNDEARNLSLINIRANTLITVYDSSPPSTRDDWTTIYVKKRINSSQMIRVKSFENSYENDFVKVTYRRKNGLDGKVSYCTIR